MYEWVNIRKRKEKIFNISKLIIWQVTISVTIITTQTVSYSIFFFIISVNRFGVLDAIFHGFEEKLCRKRMSFVIILGPTYAEVPKKRRHMRTAADNPCTSGTRAIPPFNRFLFVVVKLYSSYVVLLGWVSGWKPNSDKIRMLLA